MSAPQAIDAIKAQAHLHHAYLLGLQLMVSTRLGPQVMGEWMFRLFRRQHLEKFLSSFDKLGLSDLPHAVACARYHVLSNNIGGVGVEYFEEHDRKAWVRFRYPRWMMDGPAICGIPIEVSRGFLKGWYAHNGVSLGNPRLGFVCISEDMTGEFGLCGYFYEYDHDLAEDQRLQFARDEMPPPFDPTDQPKAPASQWDALRLEKASRNYAHEYVRNGLVELGAVIGTGQARSLGQQAARLIGLQTFAATAQRVEARDGDLSDAAAYLQRMFEGMGDTVTTERTGDAVHLTQEGLRVVRGLTSPERDLLLTCWAELWRGAMSAHRELKSLEFKDDGSALTWRLTRLTERAPDAISSALY